MRSQTGLRPGFYVAAVSCFMMLNGPTMRSCAQVMPFLRPDPWPCGMTGFSGRYMHVKPGTTVSAENETVVGYYRESKHDIVGFEERRQSRWKSQRADEFSDGGTMPALRRKRAGEAGSAWS